MTDAEYLRNNPDFERQRLARELSTKEPEDVTRQEPRLKDNAVLVVNEGHPRHGQFGKLIKLDELTALVQFSDGKQESFIDDKEYGIHRFYRHNDSLGKELDKAKFNGPREMRKTYFDGVSKSNAQFIRAYGRTFLEEPPQPRGF